MGGRNQRQQASKRAREHRKIAKTLGIYANTHHPSHKPASEWKGEVK